MEAIDSVKFYTAAKNWNFFDTDFKHELQT